MKSEHYVNREISWLSFNARVLQEAMDERVPLLERLRFLGIYSSNLDEFFNVRIGNLKRLISANQSSSQFFGQSPKSTLGEVLEKVKVLGDLFDETLDKLQAQLRQEGIFFVDETNLEPGSQAYIRDYFDKMVRPRLIPIMVDNIKKIPFLKDCVIYLFVVMAGKSGRRLAIIEVPTDVLPRFVLLPSENGHKYVITIDDIIRFNLRDVFKNFNFEQYQAYTIKVNRDSEFDLDDDIRTSVFEKIIKSVKSRESGDVVRLVYDRDLPEDLLNFILHHTKLKEFDSIIPGNRFHNARDLIAFAESGNYPARMFYPPNTPIIHPQLQKYPSVFDCIRERDILLHYPYHSFHSFIDLLREAAIDPKVKSIKMTIYRLADQSDVVNALINAVLNGKSVTVVLELQARFNEEANIKWTRKLEESGATLISSIPGMKVHAKLCLITRRDKGQKENFAAISTGNFNEYTARLYTDQALFTCNNEIAREVRRVFDILSNNFRNFRFSHLLISPFYLRKKLGDMINQEIKNAQAGKRAEIHMKVNNLVDKAMTDRLYRASAAGVKIRLLVRGACSLIPGLPDLSENIEVHSIVDRYLEHSRIFWFYNNGDEKYYISSADIMVRNLDRRVEVAIPIYDVSLQQELRDFFNLQFRDNQKSRRVSREPENQYVTNDEPPVHAQADFYEYLKNKQY